MSIMVEFVYGSSVLVPLINQSVSVLVPCSFMTIALTCSLEPGMVTPPEVLLLSRIVLAIFGFFFPYEVENCSFKVCKKLFWNFDGDFI